MTILETYTAHVEWDEETNEPYLIFPDELVDKMEWQAGDVISFIDNGDGSWTLVKKVEK